MDNLTHSLVGAVLGQAGLKRKTGLGMPTIILAANAPDIDVFWTPLFGGESLMTHRGFTHGIGGLVVLPPLLWLIMLGWDRWQGKRGTRPPGRLPVRPGWLLALAFIGCLTHPLADLMNTYGVRLLEPFSHRWFYGDVLFIIDPWILAMMVAGTALSQRRERLNLPRWNRPAVVAVCGVGCYLALNFGISEAASGVVKGAAPYPAVAVAQPQPVAFWQREVLWRNGDRYGSVAYTPFAGAAKGRASKPIGMDDPRVWERARRDPRASAFLFWSRMPLARSEGDALIIRDQRFANSRLAGDRFNIRLDP